MCFLSYFFCAKNCKETVWYILCIYIRIIVTKNAGGGTLLLKQTLLASWLEQLSLSV